MRVLITGGPGFTGSAVAVAALQADHDITIPDYASAGKREVAGRIAQIAGHTPRPLIGDIRACVAV